MAYSQEQVTAFEKARYGQDSANNTSKVFPADSTALIAGANIDVSNQVGVEGEVGISVNPLNPLNIVATSNNNEDLSRMATYFSDDGGTTWTTVFIDENQDGHGAAIRFDPNVAFDSDGNVYVVYSVNTGTTSHLMLAKSTDGGNTYAQVTEVTTDPANSRLHTAMVTTRADAHGADDVLVLWARVVTEENIQAALSLDGGATFPIVNNNINDATQRTFLPWAVVDDAGDFHVAWEANLEGTSPDGRIFHDVLDGATLADGTDVAVSDIQITDQFQATSKLPAQPDRGVWSTVTIDADRSGGPNDGRIYISYTDRASTATDDTNIFVRFSDDGGCNWSCPIQINDDGGTTSQFLPRLALDQTTGDVYAAWYDARNDAANNQQVDIFTAVSVNGGTSWGPNEQLTTAQSDESMNNPLRDPNNYTEYMGLAAFGGAAFVGWTDARAANFTTGNNEEIFFGQVSRAGKIADDKHDDNDKVVKGKHGHDILAGNDGADVFAFRDNQTRNAMITDFDGFGDVVKMVDFGASFDPLAAVSATSPGTELDLGGGNSVLLFRTAAEFSADHFLFL
ncbi:exo-alpha-sialidase [Bradyrhizobium sp. 157]|uniref:sialidase family protein n=1 Tax=Bradyrhizobium sp. 157 TaxID=2782631 RepID=UPI001FFAD91F|nr:sialidase family protein [Bradyrhizobium sp. 157]MCK1637153.1 exo-alpha-sialidase [Bradyrhizobium sp. 157]